MIWEWVSANPSFKDRRIVGVFLERTKVENPVILSVSVLQKSNRIFSAIPIQSLYARGRISHDDYSVCNIDEIWPVVCIVRAMDWRSMLCTNRVQALVPRL